MNPAKRSAFQQELINDLIESKAIDIEAINKTFSKFSKRAILDGEQLVNIINRNFIINCGWPGPELDIVLNKPGLKSN